MERRVFVRSKDSEKERRSKRRGFVRSKDPEKRRSKDSEVGRSK